MRRAASFVNDANPRPPSAAGGARSIGWRSVTALLIALLAVTAWLGHGLASWFGPAPRDAWTRAAGLLSALFVMWFGACIGSFLNVVIWRLPRGKTIVHGGSACPKCGAAISAWDNVPVLSWLWLRGRCRWCAQPIAVQYPLVELAVSAVFVLVSTAYLWPPGAGWLSGAPHAMPDGGALSDAGSSSGLGASSTDRIIGRAVQAALTIHWLCLLIAAAKMKQDGQRVPASMTWYAGTVQLGAVILYSAWALWAMRITSDAQWQDGVGAASWRWWAAPTGVGPWWWDARARVVGLVVAGLVGLALLAWRKPISGWEFAIAALTGWTLGVGGLVVALVASAFWRWGSRGEPTISSWTSVVAVLVATMVVAS